MDETNPIRLDLDHSHVECRLKQVLGLRPENFFHGAQKGVREGGDRQQGIQGWFGKRGHAPANHVPKQTGQWQLLRRLALSGDEEASREFEGIERIPFGHFVDPEERRAAQ